MTGARPRPRPRLTRAKADRALLAIVALIEAEDLPRTAIGPLDDAADLIRDLRDKAAR